MKTAKYQQTTQNQITFEWSEVQRVIFKGEDFGSDWIKLTKNAKKFSNLATIQIISDEIDYEQIRVEEVKQFLGLKELRFKPKTNFKKESEIISKDIGQTLNNCRTFYLIPQELPNLKINAMNSTGAICINQVTPKLAQIFNNKIIQQVFNRRRLKKQNGNDSSEHGNQISSSSHLSKNTFNKQIKGVVTQLADKAKQKVIQELTETQRNYYMKRQAQKDNKAKHRQAARMKIQQNLGMVNSFLGSANLSQNFAMNSSLGTVANNPQNSIMNSSLGNIPQNNFIEDNSKIISQSILANMSQFQKWKMERKNRK